MDKHPFQNWSRDDAQLLKTSLSKGHYDPVPVVEACERAAKIVDSYYITKEQYAIPLFKADSPSPTGEYVKYKPESEEVLFHDKGKGYMNRLSAEDVATTHLGQRIYWWLPEAQQDVETLNENQLPPQTVSPGTTLSDGETSAFFDEMRGLVKAERTAEKQGNKAQYASLELEAAINQGAMAGPLIPLGTASYEGNRVYTFQLSSKGNIDDSVELDLRDDAGIFPDNEYIVAIREQENIGPIQMKTVYVGDTELWLRPLNGTVPAGSGPYEGLTGDESEIWIHDLLNPLPYNRRRDAITTVQQNQQKKRLLSGNRDVSFSPNKFAVPDPEIELNESQERALAWAEAANDCVCIHGPPGTGKTRTLTAYIEDAVTRGQRVLITAHSNQAVDNLLVGDSTVDDPEGGTLHAIAQNEDSELTIARSGTNTENPVVRRYYQSTTTTGADIVAATTNGSAKFDENEFDVAVVDEATQASRAATAIAFSVSEKLVLAGDHKQLPPFAASDEKLGDEQRLSLFETLLNRFGEDIAVMLTTQYRMNENIAAFPNQAFYDGQLETSDINREWTVDDLSPLMGINIKGEEKQRSASHSYYNPEEAEAAAKQVKLLTISGLSPANIGIIVAYRGQVKEINNKLVQLDVDNTDQVTVDTVDAFQGSEREAIIVSFVRSNNSSESGFLTIPEEGPRRLNVALTRSRKRLVMIGDWNTLGERAAHLSSKKSCAGLYAELEEYIRESGKMLDKEIKPTQ